MRKARNRLEIDLLPPFGEPEVSMVGDVAFYGGILIAGGIGLSKVLE